ncbi:N(4)-(beta-N-acetylglucosaminyl)-L-asparaginase [Paraburkholderia sp. HD33-4]|uniref:N(4)-(beta-N-acetylglucosaminyl)-L-asparaginase n=1 Tax=Paraburkholderia sp. HD33-4 TaxID=2883242 RepID=UPI001F34D6E6|nr:N(4)-(beta-N-acetylglucosaminyl)-L-asparaginase [Paraburkholderia sp. HD33-4]
MIILTNNEGKSGIGLTAELLRNGGAGLDAVEAGIRLVEDDEEVRTVGRGGWPNLLGEVELDASLMDGSTLRTGAVGGLKGFRHPVSVARAVMERLPHELLIGEGAARYAAETAAERCELLAEHSRKAYAHWFDSEVSAADKAAWPNVPLERYCHDAVDPEIGKDTTVFLALDSARNVVSGTSTSGWGWKYPGRLGDSPVIGAGSYADSRYGACACTGAGEMTIRAGTARAVVLYMKMGMSVERAVSEAVDDMRALKGGLISRVTIHAIDAAGNHRVVAVNGLPGNHYWVWTPGMAGPQRRDSELIQISEGEPQSKRIAMQVYTDV